MDLISRQAAIDAVNVGNLHPGIISSLKSIIEEIPSAQEWIPVTERLPDVYSKVLVTRKAFIADFILVDLAYFNASKTLWETEELSDVDVLAWMTLPEPYQSEVDKE